MTDVTIHLPDASATGCTCGPWWAVIPPSPCPHHSFKIQPYTPLSPKELAEAYRRMADAIDPPIETK